MAGSDRKVVFLVHTDLDGACSGAIAKRVLGENIRIYFSGPRTLAESLSKIRSCQMLGIVDIALNHNDADAVVEELRRIKESGCEVLWVDHHEWVDADVKKVSQLGIKLIIEKSPSAASLLYRHLAPNDEISRKIAEIADDGDSNTNSLELTLAYKVGAKTNADRKKLIEMLARGEFYNEEVEKWKRAVMEEEKTIDKLSREARTLRTASGLSVAFVDLRRYRVIGSLLAKKLQMAGHNIVFILYADTGGVLYGDGSVDLLPIALKYNGGGHRNACGVNYKLNLIDRFMLKIYRKYVPAGAKRILLDLAEL
ncbi:MAG: DHH family phosphoesterase [Nitrososphaeria archaeon]